MYVYGQELKESFQLFFPWKMWSILAIFALSWTTYRHFSFHYFSLFGKSILSNTVSNSSSERNDSFPFWELFVWLLRIDKDGQKFLPGRIENGKKKTTEPPRLLKNRYAPSFPPNLLSITNLIGAAGDVLLLLLWCSCLPPPIFLYPPGVVFVLL